jgi:hypothetical protein
MLHPGGFAPREYVTMTKKMEKAEPAKLTVGRGLITLRRLLGKVF